jgi:hypothetical protein
MKVIHKSNNHKFITEHLFEGKVRDVKENITIQLEWEDNNHSFIIDEKNNEDNEDNKDNKDNDNIDETDRMIDLVIEADILFSFDYYRSDGILGSVIEIVKLKFNYPSNIKEIDKKYIEEIIEEVYLDKDI